MPIEGIVQPEIIPVGDGLRLRKYDGTPDFALAWYQDPDLVYQVDGVREPYTLEKLQRMYSYLDQHGELYWIEAEEDEAYRPIGDVTFSQEDMPIVIGEAAWRGCGVGRKVIAALVQRGFSLGYEQLHVGEIYDWNEASRRCFESVGFRQNAKTNKGASYVLKRKDLP